jgi:hypothetical protein
MAVIVVDQLEIVDIQQNEADGQIVAAGSLEFVRQAFLKVAVIVKIGQPIGDGEPLQDSVAVFQLLFQALLFGDILDDQQDSGLAVLGLQPGGG